MLIININYNTLLTGAFKEARDRNAENENNRNPHPQDHPDEDQYQEYQDQDRGKGIFKTPKYPNFSLF